ncbi:MAG: methionyl-tRNA formyltransferase [Microvirga sp.]
MRIIFMGSPEFAVPSLNALVEAGHDVVAAYCQPPRPAGRGKAERRTAVHERADELGIPVRTPKSLRDSDEQGEFCGFDADIAVVAAYGLILPKEILEGPKAGCINVHASLLPRWRGAAPIQRAIMAGDAETGVAVMKMEEGLDTGPVAMVERVPIGPEMTAGELHDALARLGADLMGRALAALARGALTFTPQGEDGVTYARKITNEEARIDWAKPAPAVHDHIRGLAPFPGAFFMADLGRGGERVKVLRAAPADGSGEPGLLLDAAGTVACQEGAVRLRQVQRAGRGVVAAEEFLRGARLHPGIRLA